TAFKAFKGAALAMLTPVFVIFGIVAGIVTPTESAIIAAAYSLFLGMVVYRTVTVREVGTILYETGRFASISLFAIGTASIFGWLLAYYNVPRLIIGLITEMELSGLGTALIIAFLFLFFGLFIDAIPTIIILGTVLLPVAIQADISPIVFAMIGIISLAFGLVTPPLWALFVNLCFYWWDERCQRIKNRADHIIPNAINLVLNYSFPRDFVMASNTSYA
ncbi:TRAP transporter large permease subunit, partial [Marinomonas sp.]